MAHGVISHVEVTWPTPRQPALCRLFAGLQRRLSDNELTLRELLADAGNKDFTE